MKLEKAAGWTETEDEILKAGVMKYGINRWSKVCSLLPSKSPSQCKLRWQEYVCPMLDRSGWTQGDDEKLLTTAQALLPQWSLVGQVVGRSAQECYERYNELTFGKIDVFKHAELTAPSDAKDMEIVDMAKARIANCKSRKDIKRERLRKRKAKTSGDQSV